MLVVVLVNASVPLCAPTGSASAAALSVTVTVAEPPGASGLDAPVTMSHAGAPVTVNAIGTWPVLLTV